MLKAKVNGAEIFVGLDTFSTYSLVSFELVKKLNWKVVEKDPGWMISTAGTIVPTQVTKFVKVVVEVPDVPVFELELGVTQIPCQMLIGWSDIMKYGMLNELVKLGNVQIPVVNEIAPEELVEDEFGAIALSARKGSEVVEVDPGVKKWMQLYPEVMSEVLPSEPARLEPIKLKLKEGHQLPVSSPPYQQNLLRKLLQSFWNKSLLSHQRLRWLHLWW